MTAAMRGVVVDDLALGEPGVGVEDLVEIGDGQLAAADGHPVAESLGLTAHLLGRLVGAQAPPDRMAQVAVGGPLGELDLADQRRTYPVRRRPPRRGGRARCRTGCVFRSSGRSRASERLTVGTR